MCEIFLKEILTQHVQNKITFWANREKEFLEHIDAILNELNEIRQEIKYLENI